MSVYLYLGGPRWGGVKSKCRCVVRVVRVVSVVSEVGVMGTVDVTKDSRSAELIFWRECESSDRNRLGGWRKQFRRWKEGRGEEGDEMRRR